MSARITVVGSAYYQQDGIPPSQVSFGFARLVTADEQAYSRRYSVGESWAALDFGWVKRVALLSVQNLGHCVRATYPTEEETADDDSRVLEVGTSVGEEFKAFAVVRPGESLPPFCPADAERIVVRCRSKGTKIAVHAFPG